jgi:DNA-binding NtrC family response regulator
MNRILIVDDEPSVLSALKRALRRRFGSTLVVETEVDANLALQRVCRHDYRAVVSDLRMPRMDGIEFLTAVASLQPQSVRLILTGSADFATAQRAINESGVFRYLTKPWNDEELAGHIDAALAEAERARQPLSAAPTAQELERRRLESLEPGITEVEWGPAGEVLMPDLLDQAATRSRP